MTFTHNNKTYKVSKWEKYGKSRLYVSKATGFKNRPWEKVGYYKNDESFEFVPGHTYTWHIGDALQSHVQSCIKSS